MDRKDSTIPPGEEEDVVSSMRAPGVASVVPKRTKGFSDLSGMILRDAPYNSRMMPFNTAGLEQLTQKEQEALQDEILNAASKSGRKKTKSDIAAMMAQGFMEGGGEHQRVARKRQISSSDMITKFGYAPQLGYEDLRYDAFYYYELIHMMC